MSEYQKAVIKKWAELYRQEPWRTIPFLIRREVLTALKEMRTDNKCNSHSADGSNAPMTPAHAT
jgi:hypothetical protein